MNRTMILLSSEYSEHSLCSFDDELHGLLARPYKTILDVLPECP